jgi:DNA repair protein RadA/Sms
MAKRNPQFVCRSCGTSFSRWAGKCGSCGEWNTVEEQVELESLGKLVGGKVLETVDLASSLTSEPEQRFTSGLPELDVVLGGGLVRGSVILLAGQPGIGKSTLLMQLGGLVGKSESVLYVSGEESAHQIAMRARRLGVDDKSQIRLLSTNSANDIMTTLTSAAQAPSLIIVDSIQTLSLNEVASAPGSVSQITNVTHALTAVAKSRNSSLVLVGHVTKEGSIAGPKLLEHLVDVVVMIEGDRYGALKVVRAVKNRFGPTSESAIFDMKSTGLESVENPSATLLAERQVADGSVVLATIEGTRPLLVEVQALVSKTSFGYPKRASSGFDQNRLALLVAMLSKRTKLNLDEHDIYINAVGGIKINEPAADLAVCMALASACKGLQLKRDLVVFGELGLSGEIRRVPQMERRLAEALKLGFEGAIGPKYDEKAPKSYVQVSNIKDALNSLLE